MIREAIRGDIIIAKFTIVKYKPRVSPVLFLSLQCSINISIQNITNVFVVVKMTKEVPIINGSTEKESPIKEKILNKRKIKVNFLLPKYFKILALLDSRAKVRIDDMVYKTPTYFSGIILVRNVEFIYEDKAKWKLNKNASEYIFFIFSALIK